MLKKYIPQQGDIISTNFNPKLGKEQAGFRPAVVISASQYNQKVELLICCPITSQVKNYPFEVQLMRYQKTKGVILADQIKTIDWQARPIKYLEKLSTETFQQLLSKISVLIGIRP